MVYIGIKLKALKIAKSVKVPPQAACNATGWLLQVFPEEKEKVTERHNLLRKNYYLSLVF